MACDITVGRTEPCKDSVGGLKNMYIVNYSGTLLSGATLDANDQITGLASVVVAYKFELKGANTFDEANENSRDNGTSFWTGTGTIVLKKQDLTTQKEFKLLSYGRPQILIEDYNGNFRLAGAENGCEVSVNTASGAVMGDLNGYTLTFTSTESAMASYVSSAIVGAGAGFDFNVTA
tara:strand:+ start:1957 stop:2487 length:531 start_codon:yes stop_codon:yes gene_type:complete